MIINIACLLVAAVGVFYGLAARRELKKWARLCKTATIAVAYKRKVKLQAPLTEWLQWTRMLDEDQASSGRTVYHMGGTTVAILHPKPAEKKQEQRK